MSRNLRKNEQKKTTVRDDYFRYTLDAIEEHGENTIVWMQVGSFYEMYLKYNKLTKEYVGSKLLEIVELCNGELGEKKEYGINTEILMWGFPDTCGEEYKDKIVKHGYNIVIYDQVKNKNIVIKRELTETITPGTYISQFENDRPSNNLTCLIIKKYKDIQSKTDKFVVGYSNINVFTGRSYLFEYRTDSTKIDLTTFDELDRQLITNLPNELLIYSEFNKDEYNLFMKSITIDEDRVKKNNFNDEYYKDSKNKNNREHIFQEIFRENLLDYQEYASNIYSLQSLYILLCYVNKYNKLIIKNISLPILNSCDDSVILANHTLKQLNIIEDGINVQRKSKYSSVCSFLNNCVSKIGKRGFTDILLNPSSDCSYLENEYEMIDYLLDNKDLTNIIRSHLKNTFDIDLIRRKMIAKKTTPLDIKRLFDTMQLLKENFIAIDDYAKLKTYLKENMYNEDVSLIEICESILNKINDYLNIEYCHLLKINGEICKDMNSTFIIKKGFDELHDSIVDKYTENVEIYNKIISELNKDLPEEWFKINSREKTGNIVVITRSRSKKVSEDLSRNISFNIKGKNYSFKMSDIKFVKSTTTNDEVSLKLLQDTSRSILLLKSKLIESTNIVFNKIVETILESYDDSIDKISVIISKMDVLQCKSYNSKKYNYCRPKIVNQDRSFVDVKDLRHILIEQIQQNECYVPNDIELGKEKLGMLLYGTNAVGKTSFIRSLGIGLILAQAGMYVPAKEFNYYPYKEIFSRILGNDNLFKGLSTYMVEMQELRTIIKGCGKRSLVLGDELCSGTEQHSAFTICASGIKWLINNESTFIFATHYHELVDYESINKDNYLLVKHMSVLYDNEQDMLIYERKLKDGPGSNIYGLEVLKSLNMPGEFLEMCFNIREDLIESNILDNPKKSKYNKALLKPELCPLCKKREPVEVHHIKEQKYADENNFIDSIDKNHAGNLIWLCLECHREKQRDGNLLKIEKKVMTSKGIKLKTEQGYF